MSETKIQIGGCRFCGQQVQIETTEELTKPQLAEEATMRCGCTEAAEYQKER